MAVSKSQRNELRKLLREVIFARDEHKCLRCRRQVQLAPAHIYPKGTYRKLEFEPLNVITLCFACHICFAHKNPVEFTAWLEENISWFPKLKQMRKTDSGLILDYNLIKLMLKKELSKYV